eukprot:TRINITY_DN115101_c0_g1_i1.p2 TRINITY_DN115101_c0_g1~~TRINITY_DN115101_c0_g1_i1.p2  ORF type:complete len:120 (+),score=45.17 TRINITY_DN115101_c0_g1_i1:28-387(+)
MSARKLPPEAKRIVHVRNLPVKIEAEDLYDLFGKYGAIRQIRVGNKKHTKGRAYVVYEDVNDAANAVKHLTGFNVKGRYITVLFYNGHKSRVKADDITEADLEQRKALLEKLKKQHNIE